MASLLLGSGPYPAGRGEGQRVFAAPSGDGKLTATPVRYLLAGQKGAAMINRFQEHAANERTFLSWVRTAVAVAGFGLLIEKLPSGPGGGATGPALIGLSAALVVMSTLRFLVIRREIRKARQDSRSFGFIEVLFASMLALLLATLFVYLFGLSQGAGGA